MTNFYFNPATQRYHDKDTNKFMSKEKIREIINNYLIEQRESAQEINNKLFENKITLAQWEEQQAKYLKTLAVQLFKVGHPELGGHPQDSRCYGIIGARLRREYGFLRRFSRDISEAKLSQSQIISRMNQYISGLRFFFEEGKREGHKVNNWLWEKRRLSIAEHCSDCPYYASLGWQPLGSLPAITTRCQCGSNDKCYFEYSKSVTRPATNFLLEGNGWIGNQKVLTTMG